MQDLLQRTHDLCSSFSMQDKGLKSQEKNVDVDSAPAVPGSPIPLYCGIYLKSYYGS